MYSRSVHDGLVASFYASAAAELPWAATLTRIAEHFRSSAAVFHVYDASSKVIASENHGYSRDFSIAYYASEAYANDPRLAYFLKIPNGSIYYDHMLYDVAEMDRNRWCRESVDILKVKYQLGMLTGLPDRARAGIAILSTPEEGHASPAAIRSFRRLAPHFEQACALGHIIEREASTRSALLEALTQKTEGVILVDYAGEPSFMNDSAAQMLKAGDGLAYTGGAFVTRRSSETRKLQVMIGEAIAASAHSGERLGGRMLIARPSGKRAYMLCVMPVPRLERFLTSQSIACVIYMQDLAEAQIPSAKTLRTLFGMTEREADLAIELVRCAGLEGAAANARMSVNTARNHLQSVFRKTGTSSQAEAVQLFGRLI